MNHSMILADPPNGIIPDIPELKSNKIPGGLM